jgi:hypothetical protein
LEVLWEVFEAIQSAKINHDKFDLFVKILKTDAEVNAVLATQKKKVLAVFCALLGNELLPYAMIFTTAIRPTPKISKPFYWENPDSALALAAAFLPLTGSVARVPFSEFEKLFSESP